MARYRGILRVAVALVLLFPAARHADTRDMLIIDGGGARWRSGGPGPPPVTVDFGVIDALSAAARPSAARRHHRRSRRYPTLDLPRPETPPAPAVSGRAAPAAAPAPRRTARPGPAPEAQLPPARAGIPEPPARPAASAPAVAARPAALPERRRIAGKTEIAPPLRAFMNRAARTRLPARGAAPAMTGDGAPSDALPAARPLRAQPPPRPLRRRPAEPAAAAPSGLEPERPARFRLPPPAPATVASGTGILPPPAESGAGASAPPRRRLALDAAPGPRPVASSGAETKSLTFFYEAGATGLGAEDRARLDSLAARLAGKPGLGVEIRAYADPAEGDGVEARREALSRAMGVRRLLTAAGVTDTRIVARVADVGEEPPGRVDIVLVGRS